MKKKVFFSRNYLIQTLTSLVPNN